MMTGVSIIQTSPGQFQVNFHTSVVNLAVAIIDYGADTTYGMNASVTSTADAGGNSCQGIIATALTAFHFRCRAIDSGTGQTQYSVDQVYPSREYCGLDDVMTCANQFRDLTFTEQIRATTAIDQASRQVDTMLGTFFYQQKLQVTTQTVQYRQVKVFLPAPCLSISTLTEDGVTLTQNTDFYLYQPSDAAGNPKGTGWLERLAQGIPGFDSFAPSPLYWTNNQQAIVITGQFGYAVVPPEITKLTAYLAARILGWISYTYTKGDGQSKASVELALPDWVLTIKRNWERNHFDEQFYSLADVA